MTPRVIPAVLLAWWFTLVSGYGEGRVVGPMFSRLDCEAIRAAFLTHALTSPCWEDRR